MNGRKVIIIITVIKIHIHISDISSLHSVVLCITISWLQHTSFAKMVILSIQLVIAQLLTPRTVGQLQFACNRLTLVASFITLKSIYVPFFSLTGSQSMFIGFIFQCSRDRPTSLASWWCIMIQPSHTTGIPVAWLFYSSFFLFIRLCLPTVFDS